MISAFLSFCFTIALSGAIQIVQPILPTLGQSSPFFSQALYQQLASHDFNVIYSPYSVRAALALLLAAAGDARTFGEIDSVAFHNPQTPVYVDYSKLLRQWSNLTDVHLYSANGIFVNPNFPIERSYVDAVWYYYFAQCTNFNFATLGGPEKAINDFVERQTYGYIKNLLPPHSINAQTAVILTNTVYFNGTWEQPFNPRFTSKSDFYTLFWSKLDTMQAAGTFNIRRNVLGADVIELPYRGNFALYIALPHSLDGIRQLENYLTAPGAVYQLFEGFKRESVLLSLPKFRIDYSFQLKQALHNLGIRVVFTGDANLAGISKAGGLSVTEIFHKAVIEVQEAGTVAAAATAVEIMSSSSGTTTYYREFKVNHPFIFFLRDRQTGIILFQGKFSGYGYLKGNH